MGAFETEVFKSGNGAAVHLPSALGITPGTLVTIIRDGPNLTIKPVVDRGAVRRNNEALVEEIRAIWADAPFHEVAKRDEIEAPDRPGL